MTFPKSSKWIHATCEEVISDYSNTCCLVVLIVQGAVACPCTVLPKFNIKRWSDIACDYLFIYVVLTNEQVQTDR